MYELTLNNQWEKISKVLEISIKRPKYHEKDEKMNLSFILDNTWYIRDIYVQFFDNKFI